MITEHFLTEIGICHLTDQSVSLSSAFCKFAVSTSDFKTEYTLTSSANSRHVTLSGNTLVMLSIYNTNTLKFSFVSLQRVIQSTFYECDSKSPTPPLVNFGCSLVPHIFLTWISANRWISFRPKCVISHFYKTFVRVITQSQSRWKDPSYTPRRGGGAHVCSVALC